MQRLYTAVLILTLLLYNSAWARQEISLNGEWDLQFSHRSDKPIESGWTKINVPSSLQQREERYAWFKRNFTIPASMSGQRIFLKFGGIKFVSEVYLNGSSVGGHYGGWEPFELEITNFCRIGQNNQIMVRATDVSGVIEGGVKAVEQAKDSVMTPVGSMPEQFGIWQDVSIESRSDVYIDNVFIKTSVRNKTIEIDYELRNLSDKKRKVFLESQVYDGQNPQLKLSGTSIELLPESTTRVTLRQVWPSPKLWSLDSPNLYSLLSWIIGAENSTRIDEISNRFGFREFWIDGIYFFLNGIKIKFFATAGHPDFNSTKEDAKKLYADIRSANCVAMRLHANVWPESWYEAADEVGMLLIQETALWCYAYEYALSSNKFWENMKDHLKCMIRRDKNHPSVVMYSLENEILHTGGARFPQTEYNLSELGRFVKSIDPTRPIMYDGDSDPMGVADVENLHYPHEFPQWDLWPNTAYWVDDKTVVTGWPYREWQWEREKPLYMGEFLFGFYWTPEPYTIFVGDDAYADCAGSMVRSKAAAWSMQIEAFRMAEVSGICPWTLLEAAEPSSLQYKTVKKAYEPYAAFVKEYDSRFYSGEIIPRTIYLYNDTLHPADLTLSWILEAKGVSSGELPAWDVNKDGVINLQDIIIVISHFGEQVISPSNPDVGRDGMVDISDLIIVALHYGEEYNTSVTSSGQWSYKLGPAEFTTTKINIHIPYVSERTPLSFFLRIENGGKTVFQDEKQYYAFPVQRLNIPTDAKVAVYTGSAGSIKLLERAVGLAYTNLPNLSDIPSDTQLIIVGPNAFDSMSSEAGFPVVGEESAETIGLKRFVEEGGTAFIMQQSFYPSLLVPARLTDHSSTIAFRRACYSDMLKDISDEDLKMWRGDNLVSEHDISKPRGGCFKAIIDSGGVQGLDYLPLMEVFSGQGRYILCQLSLQKGGGLSLYHPDEEPIAQILFENIITYSLKPPERRVKTGVVQDKLDIKRDVESVGAVCDDLSYNLSKTNLQDYDVLIIEGDAPEVSRNVYKIRDFVQAGGKVLIHNLTPDNLSRLSSLFPVEISLRRNNSLPVTISQRDPAISGLANQDLYWVGKHVGSPYTRTPLSPEVVDYVMTYSDLSLENCQTVEAEGMKTEYGGMWPSGKYVLMYTNAAISTRIIFPEAAEYIFGIYVSGTPFHSTYPEVSLLVDDVRRASVMLEGPDWKIYTITTYIDAGEHKISLAFTNDDYDPATKEDRNLLIDKLMYAGAEDQTTNMKRLLTPAALAKVLLGKGFYLIDQINWHDRTEKLDKAARYITNLLVNLGASFAEEIGCISIPASYMTLAADLLYYNISGDIVAFYTNGHIYLDVQFASSREYTFEVTARGAEVAGEYPIVRLTIDGMRIQDQMLRDSEWQKLTFKTFVSAGVHRVGLAFTNDYWNPPSEDRNLEISWLKIR